MRLLICAAVLVVSGCVAFNDQCQPVVDDPEARVAYVKSGTELWLDRPNTRHANNAVGQVAADAFVWVFAQSPKPVELAVINGGALRAEGLCSTRTIIGAGPLSNGTLHEVLLFENTVTAVDVSEAELVAMFEHSAERLSASPSPVTSPAGAFLQVSDSVAVTIDCARPALSRVVSLSVGGNSISLPGRPLDQRRVRLAASQFLLSGGDGYTMLRGASTDLARDPVRAQRFGGIDSNITAAYLQQSPFNVSVAQGLEVDQGRVTLLNCTVPPRPAE